MPSDAPSTGCQEMTNSLRARLALIPGIFSIGILCGQAWADEGPDLAQLVQNPIAKVVSVPFQNNLTFGADPDRNPQDVLNIQPVLPFQLSEDWNVITRTIVPVVYQPALTPGGDTFGGIGDIFHPGRIERITPVTAGQIVKIHSVKDGHAAFTLDPLPRLPGQTGEIIIF